MRRKEVIFGEWERVKQNQLILGLEQGHSNLSRIHRNSHKTKREQSRRTDEKEMEFVFCLRITRKKETDFTVYKEYPWFRGETKGTGKILEHTMAILVQTKHPSNPEPCQHQ